MMRSHKLLVWIIVLSFLTLIISPDFVDARRYGDDQIFDVGEALEDNEDSGWKNPMVIAGIIVVAATIVYLIAKAVKPDSLKKENVSLDKSVRDYFDSTQSDNHNEMFTSDGKLVVLRW